MRKYRIVLVITILSGIAGISGCYYDKKELIYPKDTTACDTTAVKYSVDIVGILNPDCYVCHGGTAASGAGIKLDSYTDASLRATSILNQVQNGTMPKGGAKLSDCNIAKIRTWIRDGVPNN